MLRPARAFVAAGGLGKILKVEQSRNSYRPYWHRYAERPVAAEDVDWKAFLMHRRYRAFNADQYAGWFGYRDFSRGPHTNLMAHFINMVHLVTGAKIPKRAVTLGGIYRGKTPAPARTRSRPFWNIRTRDFSSATARFSEPVRTTS